jgi:hypothetical protein
MDTVKLLPSGSIASDFLPPEYLPAGGTQYTLRDTQFPHADRTWRPLTSREIETLVQNGNTAADWKDVLVTERFDPRQIMHSSFFGLVRIGAVEDLVLEHHDLKLPVGITGSRIVSCDIGDHAAIHNVHYLAHYIIGDRSILTNIDEMHVSNHAKFGNGIVKEGEDESVRVLLDLVNETGSRAVAPFDGMTTADACLWARYRDDRELMARLLELTQRRVDSRRGYYGTIGDQTVIKNSRIIKDVRTGSHCYIKGANKLKNLTINSDGGEPTQIGEGVELVNGIIGYGCRIFYGCKAVRFIMGNNCNLKYGARLIHSFLGDNSTVSCCELLNNLIFPAHEQHHNNSFLVAALVGGQSNVAAGATIGSNHNSRSNDNEIVAGRGFWPGLSTTLKHSSRFASFTLISKGDYPAEIDLPLPFSLLSHNVAERRLEVVPAFWWTRNMYALARNSWKFGARDTRQHRTQHIHFEALAPDTVEEIIAGRALLEIWIGAAALEETPRWQAGSGSYPQIVRQMEAEPEQRRFGETGRRILATTAGAASGVADGPRTAGSGDPSTANGVPAAAGATATPPLMVAGLEKTRSSAAILHGAEGWRAYGEMLHLYATRHIVRALDADEELTIGALLSRPSAPRTTEWTNLGGQLVPDRDVARLREDVRTGALDTWNAIHARYDSLAAAYEDETLDHALAVFRLLADADPAPKQEAENDREQMQRFLSRAVRLQELVRDRVHESRRKDYENPFRIATYRNSNEMNAAVGSIDDNSFVRQVAAETDAFARQVADVISVCRNGE